MKKVLLILQLLLLITAGPRPAYAGHSRPGETFPSTDQIDPSLEKDIRQSLRNGLAYLKTQQEADGSWQHYPAITALALSSFLRADAGFSVQDTFVMQAFDYLVSLQQKDGGVYVDENANYNSAIVLMAFRDAKNLDFKPVIDRLESFLLSLQFGETNGYTHDSLYYGGVGYGYKDRPDLSNLQWSLEALYEHTTKEMESSRDSKDKKRLQEKAAYIRRSLVFLSRCQNLQQTNDAGYAGNDGGFMYGPGISKAGDQNSYGSMTYAGLKSMIHARLSGEDPRVRAAFQWIENTYTVEENPGLGAQGLFYYYHTMAKSLQAYGNAIITDGKGKKHHWKDELASKLISLQRPDGSWINQAHTRWMENNPVLVTCYTLLALEEILKD